MFDRRAAIYDLMQNESVAQALALIESELNLAITERGERMTRVYIDQEFAASVGVCLRELGYSINSTYTPVDEQEYADGYDLMEDCNSYKKLRQI